MEMLQTYYNYLKQIAALTNYLTRYKMTYSEDVNRAVSTDTIDFLNARIEALEKRVEFLEAQNEINN